MLDAKDENATFCPLITISLVCLSSAAAFFWPTYLAADIANLLSFTSYSSNIAAWLVLFFVQYMEQCIVWTPHPVNQQTQNQRRNAPPGWARGYFWVSTHKQSKAPGSTCVLQPWTLQSQEASTEKWRERRQKLPYSVMTEIFISKIHIQIPLWVIESEPKLLCAYTFGYLGTMFLNSSDLSLSIN